jgi:hypothetical protein
MHHADAELRYRDRFATMAPDRIAEELDALAAAGSAEYQAARWAAHLLGVSHAAEAGR